MALFSERHGYSSPSKTLIREDLPVPVQNSIVNWLTIMREGVSFSPICNQVCLYFFNRVLTPRFASSNPIENHILDKDIIWYKKLDLIEFILPLVKEQLVYNRDYNSSIKYINSEFQRHNYAYRIIDDKIVEVTSSEEITAISDAIENSVDSVRTHLETSLRHLSASQEHPDYRNSIKEAISAVEAYCRFHTGENSLGKALKKLEQNGIIIPQMLKTAFEMLYAYTNDSKTGVRHALMDNSGNYIPSVDEATFMLVTCSAFINYLQKKTVKK